MNKIHPDGLAVGYPCFLPFISSTQWLAIGSIVTACMAAHFPFKSTALTLLIVLSLKCNQLYVLNEYGCSSLKQIRKKRKKNNAFCYQSKSGTEHYRLIDLIVYTFHFGPLWLEFHPVHICFFLVDWGDPLECMYFRACYYMQYLSRCCSGPEFLFSGSSSP